MCKRLIVLVGVMVVCTLGLNPVLVHGQTGLIGHWSLDEESGVTAADASVSENHGTLGGVTEWRPDEGMLGGALFYSSDDDTAHVEIQTTGLSFLEGTLMIWGNLTEPQPARTKYFLGHTTQPSYNNRIQLYMDSGNTALDLGLGDSHTQQTDIVTLDTGVWYHVALTWDLGQYKVYLNAVEIASGSYTGLTAIHDMMHIGNDGNPVSQGTEAFAGLLDEALFFSRVLTLDEIKVVMLGKPELAGDPVPALDAVDVARDVVLNWSPGDYAQAHDVYLGTDFVDVNTASRATPMEVLAVQGHNTNAYAPGVLDFEQTYYWRVDEVNGAPDRTIFQGEVWSFSVEPLGIPIENITATASGASPGMEASNTIDGSGLDAQDQHSTMPNDMWLTMQDGSWIQYEFDKAYKLHELLVWNSNQAVESFIGFGVKDATVETSLDGETWTAVEGVPPFAQASGLLTYTANTAIDLSGIVAKYVKITPQNAHGMVGQVGLGEVRFLYIPTTAREPDPADGSVTANLDVTLAWRSGREAVSHDVAVSMDRDAIVNGTAAVETVSEASYPTDSLFYGTIYYWQVTEVNDMATPSAYAGDIWSLTTPEYTPIDDFESFSAEEGQEVYMTWWDAFGGDNTLGGSTTGHIGAPFVETSIINGGKQSMPMFFDNNGGFINIDGASSAPTFSEVLSEFSGLDLTEGDAEVLAVSFQGDPNNGDAPLYLIVEDSTGASVTVTHPDATAIQSTTWQDWLIPMTEFGSLRENNIKAIIIGVGYKNGAQAGSEGVLYIDDLRKGTPIQ